ncbi:hypothetical protein ELG61_16430 [Rhizobium leguminosarum]|nr:hypothetical protein ELG86_16940 [Rhizobium leguminosarum]TBG69286.1 hypothetical protein ELG74_16135 [Rhizobium leguminosarum]TBH03155.1 hypothetical protein ELG70_16710 [Rhizobium leguminosarum]TBH12599.1 hypothetical protein ELG68_16335 [Rhizobium leguminosarum]TBH37649.1 hypothetical protein ELG66_18295 [Rhizobium leguminosarum]
MFAAARHPMGRSLVDKSRSLLDVILGLVPRIYCPIDRRQMLGTSPSMTKERLAGFFSEPFSFHSAAIVAEKAIVNRADRACFLLQRKICPDMP